MTAAGCTIDGRCTPPASQVSYEKKVNEVQTAVIVVFSVLIALTVLYRCAKWLIAIKSAAEQHYTVVSDRVMRNATVERFVLEMADEKPIRFTPEQLAGELAERMCKVAFWCAQQRPSARPSMSAVVKMLEGETEIAPPPNPFQYLMEMEPAAANLRMAMASTTVNTSNHIISF